jgi:hypothetical protein
VKPQSPQARGMAAPSPSRATGAPSTAAASASATSASPARAKGHVTGVVNRTIVAKRPSSPLYARAATAVSGGNAVRHRPSIPPPLAKSPFQQLPRSEAPLIDSPVKNILPNISFRDLGLSSDEDEL